MMINDVYFSYADSQLENQKDNEIMDSIEVVVKAEFN